MNKRSKKTQALVRRNPGRPKKTVTLAQALLLVNERFAAGGLRLTVREYGGYQSVSIKLGYREMELQFAGRSKDGDIRVIVDGAVQTLLTWEEAEETVHRHVVLR